MSLNEELILASETGDLEQVQTLLEQGSDPNFMTCRFRSPLTEATWENNTHIIELLLEWGADTNIGDGEALLKANIVNHINAIKILLEWGADPNKGLCNAIDESRPQIVQLLLEWGADPNGKQGKALNWAVQDVYVEIINLLLDWGADPNDCTCTSLFSITYSGHWHIIEILLDRGLIMDNQVLKLKKEQLEKFFKLFLNRKDAEHLFKISWPQWLMEKYASQIEIINRKIVD